MRSQERDPAAARAVAVSKAGEADSVIAAGALIGIALIPVLFARALDPTESVWGVIQLVGAWALGVMLLRHIPSVRDMIPIVRAGVALVVGSVAFYPLCSVQSFGASPQWPILALSVGAMIVAIRQRAVRLAAISPAEWLLLGVAVALTVAFSFHNGDLGRSLLRYPEVFSSPDDVDAPYFTSLVATLRHGVQDSAIYERGTPLTYSVMAAWAPATFAAASQAPSHVALWGVWMPLFKIIGALLIAECVLRLVGRRQAKSLPAAVAAAAVVLFFLLQPLHPQYVMTGEANKFVWGGGFLWGGLNLPTTAGIVWATLALAISLPHSREARMNLAEMALVAVVLGALCATKVPLFLATCVVLTVAAVMRARRGDQTLLTTLAGALPVALVAYVWAYGGGTRRPEFSLGYLPRYFAALAGLSPETPGVVVKGLLIAAAVYLVWAGMRLVGGALLLRLRDERVLVSSRREIVLGSVAALAAGVFMATVLAIPRRDERGLLIGDESFNLQQFPRAAFLFISIVGVSGIIAWFLAVHRTRAERMALTLLVGTWSLLALVGLWMGRGLPPQASRDGWLSEARREMLSLRPELAAIDPTDRRSLYLAASDVGWFWVSQTLFVMSSRHSERWAMFSSLLSGTDAARSEACRAMWRDGVDALIALPAQTVAIERFSRECGFARPPGTRWVWLRPARAP
jgi:hypothetical protein